MASYPQTPPQDIDPFANADKVPSLSFKDAPIGTVYSGVVTALPKEVQGMNFESGLPDFWSDGNPKKSVVLRIEVDTETGKEERSVWAKVPSSMYRAIGAAQSAAKVRIALGGRLWIRFDSETPPTNPRMSPQKIYSAKYEPPAIEETPDPWGETPAAQPPAPTAAGQAARPQSWGPAPAQPAAQPLLPGTPAPADVTW